MDASKALNSSLAKNTNKYDNSVNINIKTKWNNVFFFFPSISFIYNQILLLNKKADDVHKKKMLAINSISSNEKKIKYLNDKKK